MVRHSREERISKPAVCKRHRAGQNFSASTRQAATGNQFKTFLEFFF